MTKRKLEFSVGGMHCASCSSRIERVIGGMPEVESASVSLATDTAQVALRPESDSKAVSDAILKAVTGLGFSAELLTPPSAGTDGSSATGGRSGAVHTLELAVKGMHCAACSSRIERGAGKLPGMVDAAVNLPGETGRFTFDPAILSRRQIRQAIADLGFT